MEQLNIKSATELIVQRPYQSLELLLADDTSRKNCVSIVTRYIKMN